MYCFILLLFLILVFVLPVLIKTGSGDGEPIVC